MTSRSPGRSAGQPWCPRRWPFLLAAFFFWALGLGHVTACWPLLPGPWSRRSTDPYGRIRRAPSPDGGLCGALPYLEATPGEIGQVAPGPAVAVMRRIPVAMKRDAPPPALMLCGLLSCLRDVSCRKPFSLRWKSRERNQSASEAGPRLTLHWIFGAQHGLAVDLVGSRPETNLKTFFDRTPPSLAWRRNANRIHFKLPSRKAKRPRVSYEPWTGASRGQSRSSSSV